MKIDKCINRGGVGRNIGMTRIVFRDFEIEVESGCARIDNWRWKYNGESHYYEGSSEKFGCRDQ
jgi:hypothetical protein